MPLWALWEGGGILFRRFEDSMIGQCLLTISLTLDSSGYVSTKESMYLMVLALVCSEASLHPQERHRNSGGRQTANLQMYYF